jgi:Transport protein Avl9
MNKKPNDLRKKEFDTSTLEEFLCLLRDKPIINSRIEYNTILKPLYSIHVIGFHHKKGSIVEFSYPCEIKNDLLVYLALPDCVHNENVRNI